jgi:tetratricopeptide (TPR) repeat protein
VRQLANKLFDIDIAVRGLPGSVAARQLIVNTSLEYLGRLADDARDDPELALDVGTAYMRVARVQGIPISPNLGQLEQADKTLTTAKALIDSVLAARPDNRTAFFRQAQIAHDRMIVAGLRRPDDQALPFARQSAGWLDRYLAGGPVDASEARQVVLALNNVGNRFRIENEFDEALRYTRRGLEIARAAPELRSQLGGLFIGMGRIQRDRGALDDALETYGQAISTLDPASRSRPGREPVYEKTFALAMIDRAEILAGDSNVSAGRPAEAIALLRRAFAIADENAHRDANDADSRSLLSSGGRPLAELLRDVDAAQSLEVYDHMLRHLGEIANNSLFRRNEVRALAGSSYALRRLGRDAEARQRIDAAFTRLRELKLYPAEKIEVGSEPHDALMALAEHHAAHGDVRRALEACDGLMQGIAAAESRPEERLRDAAAMSHLYASIANIQRRSGQAGRAAALEARRRQLWEAWDRKLPGNPFVMARLSAARVD